MALSESATGTDEDTADSIPAMDDKMDYEMDYETNPTRCLRHEFDEKCSQLGYEIAEIIAKMQKLDQEPARSKEEDDKMDYEMGPETGATGYSRRELDEKFGQLEHQISEIQAIMQKLDKEPTYSKEDSTRSASVA